LIWVYFALLVTSVIGYFGNYLKARSSIPAELGFSNSIFVIFVWLMFTKKVHSRFETARSVLGLFTLRGSSPVVQYLLAQISCKLLILQQLEWF
jgi:hypothetical protein